MNIQKVYIFAVRFPESSGGATYVYNLRESFIRLGIDVEIVTLYQGSLITNFSDYTVLFKNEPLSRQSIRSLTASSGALKYIELLQLMFMKKIYKARVKKYFKSLNQSSDSSTALIFTHVRPYSIAKDYGFSPQQSPSIIIGQHHSPYISVEEDHSLQKEMVNSFTDIDFFTALSQEDANKFSKLLGINSIGIPNPKPAIPESIEIKEISNRTKKAVILARFSDEKRVDLAIDLFVKAKKITGDSEWVLEVYGEGTLEENLREQIQNLKVDSFVKLMGITPQPLKVLAEARVNLLTSRYEGFGMTVLEAASVGTPSLSFAVSPGLIELSDNLSTPTVPEGEYSQYLSYLVKLMTDDSYIIVPSSELIVNSERYSSSAIAERWIYLLQNTIKN